MWGQLSGSLVALVIFVLVLAPPGYWLLRRAGGGPPRALDLGLALGVGWSVVLPLLLIERLLGAPVLVLPAVVVAVIALRKEWHAWLETRADGLFWLIPLVLGALAFWVNQGDARWDDAGASFRLGFDVTDRAFYGLVAQEVLRSPPPEMQNPFFAGAPLAYSFFPALAGLVLHLYGGQEILPVFLLQLPIVGFVFLALALDSFLREWAHGSIGVRILTPALCVLGGDLSFLFPASGVAGGERASHFLAFCSFSAESLYYNPWVFGFPLVLVLAVLGGRFLRGGGRGWLWLSAWSLATLWQTKVFACIPLVLAAVVAAALLRHRRLGLLAAGSVLLVLPWAGLSLAARAATFHPFVLAPLCPVLVSFSAHPEWRPLADLCVHAAAWVRWPSVALATVIVLAGGMGARLFGLPALVQRARHDASGLAAWLGLAMLASVVLALSFGGQPTLVDCVQFLILPQLLMWVFAGPRLCAWLGANGIRRVVGATLAIMSLLSPLGYVLRKTLPERFTSAASIDRHRLRVSPGALAAATWLSRRPERDRPNLVTDWRASHDDPAGRRPAYLAALSGKRLAAHAEDAHIAPAAADERRLMVAEVYDTADADRAVAKLTALRADWVWVEARRPLRYASPRLQRRAQAGEVSVYEFVPQRTAR